MVDQFKTSPEQNPLAQVTDAAVSQLLNASHDPSAVIETIIAEGTPVVWAPEGWQKQFTRIILSLFQLEVGFLPPSNVMPSDDSLDSVERWQRYSPRQDSILDTLLPRSKPRKPLWSYETRLQWAATLLYLVVGMSGPSNMLNTITQTGLTVFTTKQIAGMAYGFHHWLLHQVQSVAQMTTPELQRQSAFTVVAQENQTKNTSIQALGKRAMPAYKPPHIARSILHLPLGQTEQVIRSLSLEETVAMQKSLAQEMEALCCIQRIMEAMDCRKSSRFLSAKAKN